MRRRILATAAVMVLMAAAALAESPDEVYSFAEHLYGDAMYEAAAQQYLKFAGENPTDRRAPAALERAADCLVKTNDSERAIAVLRAVVDTYPKDADVCAIKVRIGRLLLKLTRFEEADREFTDVVLTMPDCPGLPDALLGKGQALVALGDYSGAAEVFSSLVQNHLESAAAPRAAFHLAFCQKKMGREAQALNSYQRVVTDFPGDPLAGFASLEAARMFAERGDTAAALDFYRNAKRMESKVFFVPASEEGAAMLGASGRHLEALQWYEELLARPDLDDARTVYIRAAEAAWHAGEFEAVRRIADGYEAKYPKAVSPRLTYVKALAELERGEYDRVLSDADALETLSPGTEWAYRASRIRGDALLEMGRARDAVVEWRRFVSLASDSASRVRTLGRAAEVQLSVVRDTVAAIATLWEQLDAERRAIPGEMVRVAGILEDAGRYARARELYADVVGRFPLSSEAERAEARIAFLDEFTVTDYEAAAREMDRVAFEVARMNDWDGLVRLIEARIDVLKDFEGALELAGQIHKSSKKTAYYPRIIYLEGAAHARMAEAARGRGRDEAARDEMKKALRSWDELTRDHAATEWAASAASETILLRGRVEGVVDTSAVKRVLARYAERADRVGLTALMADYYYDRGDAPAQAQRYYREALALDPDNLRLRYKSGLALAQAKRYREALREFEAVAGSDDGRVGLLATYEAGRALRRLGRFDDAVARFDRVAASDPRGSFGADAELQAADCRYLQRRFDEALERYRRAEALARDDQRRWEVSYRLALCLEKLGKEQEALARLEDCIVSPLGRTLRPRVYQAASRLAESLGDPARQAAILETYVTEFDRDKEALAAARRLVRIYLQIGETDKATVVAEWIEERADKDDAEATALLAMTRYRAGRTGEGDELRRRLEKSAGSDSPLLDEIDVEAAKYLYEHKSYAGAARTLASFAGSCRGPGACEEARFVYAVSLMGADETDKAIAAAQSFFRDYPVSARGPALHLKLGNVLARDNRLGESLLHYQEAAETTTDSVTAFTALKNLGVAYQDLKRWRDAERAWTQVLNRFPASDYASEAALNVARCKMEYGDYTGAVDAYEKSLPLLDGQEKARAFYWMGTSYERLGDYQSAVVQFLKVPYLASGGGLFVVTAELKAAECYGKLGRDGAAREIYNRVIEKYGAGSNWGQVARKGLAALDDSAERRRGDDGGTTP